MKMDRREEIQGIMMEAENYRRHIESLKGEMQLLEATMKELNASLAALDALKENKKGASMLVPIGSGSFVKAELKDSEKVIVGMGAGISLEKSIEEAKAVLGERGKEIAQAMEKLQKNALEVSEVLMQLEDSYRRSVSALQSEQQQKK